MTAPRAALAPLPSVVSSADLERLLTEFPAPTRAETVTQAMRALSSRGATLYIAACELALEAYSQGYWSKVRRLDGSAYLTADEYLAEVLGVQSYRSALRRIAIGRVLAMAPAEQRDALRGDLAALGVAKAAVLAPALEAAYEAPGDAETAPAPYPMAWVEKARALPAEELQRAVSGALESKPRGRAPGSSLQAYLTQRLGSIERAAVIGDFFRLGAAMAPGASAAEILICGMEEAVASWAPAVEHRGEPGVVA